MYPCMYVCVYMDPQIGTPLSCSTTTKWCRSPRWLDAELYIDYRSLHVIHVCMYVCSPPLGMPLSSSTTTKWSRSPRWLDAELYMCMYECMYVCMYMDYKLGCHFHPQQPPCGLDPPGDQRASYICVYIHVCMYVCMYVCVYLYGVNWVALHIHTYSYI